MRPVARSRSPSSWTSVSPLVHTSSGAQSEQFQILVPGTEVFDVDLEEESRFVVV